ncbi:hypothetical protein [Pseudoalteromonas luteoviolacea]|uniref:ATP-binding protein n=1 Tax=Pseudoalteromonas luteoviolacea S4060-1 TaxID=1365257 RepID=A0A167N506_9GAMM|nr:hypothetical protein [Pseudoalteromonas luteoviolacea]KZN67511.1 hypothetical protein N478_01805 [Pseudoalteromonas luteoviolacea S4060-1]
MISLPATLDIDKVEDFQNKLTESTESDELQLPVGNSNFAFGGFATAIQAVNTWASLNKERKVVIKPSANSKEVVIEKVIEQPHKFTALMMAKKVDLPSEDEPNIRGEANRSAKSAIEAQSRELFGQNRGRLCWYSFVDHSTLGFDRNFYDLSPDFHPSPKNIEQITSVIESMVRQSSKVAGGGVLPDTDRINSLGRMFFELFINTHEHGSRDIERKLWLKPATRVIYTYGINLTDDAINIALQNDENLKRYTQKLASTKSSTRRFVELSIVDSGLGYVGRWLADHTGECSINDINDINVNEQYNILKKCFQFRSSSTSNEIKGNGLPAVMANLTKLNGFMKVRSNKLSVYRDFVNQPFSSNEADSFEFNDWRSSESCSQNITEHNEVRGVSVTVLIPLYDKVSAKD